MTPYEIAELCGTLELKARNVRRALENRDDVFDRLASLKKTVEQIEQACKESYLDAT